MSETIAAAYTSPPSFNLEGINTTLTGRDFPVINIASSSGTPDLTINLSGSDEEISGVISSSIRNLIKTGANTLTLLGENTYTGTTTVCCGTLNISSDDNLGEGILILCGGTLKTSADFTLNKAITLTANSTIDTNGHALILSGIIDESGGSYGLSIIGGGSIHFTSKESTYTGSTTFLGTTQIGSIPAYSNSAPTFDIEDGIIFTQEGKITGEGALVKTGLGTLELSYSDSINGHDIYEINPEFGNTYAGGTLIRNGVVLINYSNGLSNGLIYFDARTPGNPLGSGAEQGTVSILKAGANINIGNPLDLKTAAVIDTNGFNMTVSGDITGLGDFTKVGEGTLTLSGNNQNTGSINLSNGTLELRSLGAANRGNNSTIYLSSNTTLKSSVVAIFENPITFEGNSVTINVSAQTTFKGELSGNMGTLNIDGGQNITLSGDQSGEFTSIVNGANTKLIIPQTVILSVGEIIIGSGASFKSTGYKIIFNSITFM